jgi:hypothetical protein
VFDQPAPKVETRPPTAVGKKNQQKNQENGGQLVLDTVAKYLTK